jgi:hypothetical protein
MFLEMLPRRGLRLYLASGTDEPFVKAEAELLGLAPYEWRHAHPCPLLPHEAGGPLHGGAKPYSTLAAGVQ